MKRLINILLLLIISISIVLAQNTQITLDTPSVVNPTDPFTVTGSYTLAITDTLSKIQYFRQDNPSAIIEVTNIDTITQTFSVTLDNVGSLADGEYNYTFQLILLEDLIGAEDTLHIKVDKTPPVISDHDVAQEYWSFAFPQFDITIQFNEKVNLRDDTKIKLISEKGRELIIPSEKLTLQNDNFQLFIQVSSDLIDNDSLAQWTGKINLSIEKIADIYGNTANIPLDNIITADFIKPEVVDFTPHYGRISNKNTTVKFTVSFSEPIEKNQNLIKIKKGNLEITPILTFNNSNSSFTFDLKLEDVKTDSSWNGDVEIEMQTFSDQAGNTNNAPESVLPRIFIDFLAPQVTQTILSTDTINIAFISQNNYSLVGLIRFNEPLDTSNTDTNISLSNQDNELSIPVNFLGNQQEIRFVINQEVLEQEQKSWQDFQNIAQLFIKNVQDTVGNKIENIEISKLKIDVVRPMPPTLTNEINSIVKEKSISFEGTKEYKAELYFNGELLSDFTNDSTWSKFNVFLPEDGFYKFSFWQIDWLGNVSDTVDVRVLADRQVPHFVGQGAQLQINTDEQTNKPYFILFLYFNEIVNFEPNAHIQLKTENDYFQVEASQAQNLSTIQKFIIKDSIQIDQIFNWITQQKDIQIYLPAETIADLAGNKNSGDLIHDVFVFIESMISEVSWINKYISPNQDGVNDELRATVFLNSKVPDQILFRVVALNNNGQSILQINEIFKISEDAGKTKLFENGQLKLNASGSDSNRVVYLDFKWAPTDLEEGKYIVSFYVQELWEQASSLNIGSLPISATIYSDVTPPEIVRITPVAGDNNQYIDIQPDFVFTIDKEIENSPIKDAYLMFSRAIKNNALPIDSLQMDLFPYKLGEVYEFNCKAYNIKLEPGALTVTVTLVDSANNKTLRRLHYTVVGDTVEGIKDIYNFPNPFNPKQGQKTNIAFAAGQLNTFKLYIFDMGFNLVYYKEFSSNLPGLASFRKTVPWDGTNLRGEIVANGVYFARIVSDNFKSPVLKIVVNNK
ncbi:hypothetical protein ACX8XP_09235 [Calditrichota bacterium LG25]